MQDKLEKTVENLHALTVEVTALAGVVKSHEQGFSDIREDIRSMATGIKEINANMTLVTGLTHDVAQLKEVQSEHKGDIRVLRHDLNNVISGAQAIKVHQEKIAGLESRVSSLETVRNQAQGAALATRVIVPLAWAVMVSLVAICLWLLSGNLPRVLASLPGS